MNEFTKDSAVAIFDGYDRMIIDSNVTTIMADDLDTATITAGLGDMEIRFDIWDSENDHAVENVWR